jgi:hypothetical protein
MKVLFFQGFIEAHKNHIHVLGKVQDQERFIAGGPATGISKKQTPSPTNPMSKITKLHTPALFRTW